MNPDLLFSDSIRSTTELLFAIKLNTNTEIIEYKEVREFFKSLKKTEPQHFKKCDLLTNPEIGGNIILSQEKDRVIAISPANIEYRESGKFNKEAFNRICKQLYYFYTDCKDVTPDDIKIMGKVYHFDYKMNIETIDLFREKTGMYSEDSIKQFEIRTTLIEDIFNIHIYLAGFNNESDRSKTLSVKLDVNNANQEDGLEEDTFDRITQLCDSIAKDRLNSLLNKNFA